MTIGIENHEGFVFVLINSKICVKVVQISFFSKNYILSESINDQVKKLDYS